MKRLWALSLGLSLGMLTSNVPGEEIQWRPSTPRKAPMLMAEAEPTTSASRTSFPAASLGRPVPMHEATTDNASMADRDVSPVSFSPARLDPPRTETVRGQSPEFSAPSLAPPPGAIGMPPTPQEKYNCGVVTDPGPNGPGWFGRSRDWLNGFDRAGAGTRGFLQSDHCFDNFISPVSNPFYFEDPRSLTEVRPIFIHQGAPRNQFIYRGGNIDILAFQARVAVTERFDIVMNKFGVIWNDPNSTLLGFQKSTGMTEVWLGPKYTIVRNDTTGTLFAAGLTFQIPAGPAKVYQDTGNLSLDPYFSFAQNFFRTSYGSLNFMNTTGYAFGANNARTDFFHTSLHLDYDILDMHKIYPLVEVNWFNLQAGTARNLGFEGRDLINFGSQGVSGHKDVSLAFGLRYKFIEAIQAGFAYEFPINAAKDILDYRLTFDMIFRY